MKPQVRAGFRHSREHTLSSQVNRACEKWLADRGLSTRRFKGFDESKPMPDQATTPKPTRMDLRNTAQPDKPTRE